MLITPSILLQQASPLANFLANCPTWFWVTCCICFGACVGSFLNVVIYRVPEGKSIVTPPSACPKCGQGIRGYDNIPIISWLILRGKCRNCKNPISFQYPLIEAFTAAVFLGLYLILYHTSLRPQWHDYGIAYTWPAFIVYLVLLSSLIATTLIDARLFIIPLSIPFVSTIVTLVILPLASIFIPAVTEISPNATSYTGVGIAFGGTLGLFVALALMHLGYIPRSFDDTDQLVPVDDQQNKDLADEKLEPSNDSDGENKEKSDDELWYEHPHVRREILKECLFLLFPIAGMILGAMFLDGTQSALENNFLRVLSGIMLGYLTGGGIVWAIRIFGTLVFGKEAMGLGDVPLLAAIGAAIGAVDSVIVFFLAPFFGLTYALLAFGSGHILKKRFQQIPYGPHLAAAAVMVIIFHQPLQTFFGVEQWLDILGIIN